MKCPDCNGIGEIRKAADDIYTCETCNATGEIDDLTCPQCNGSGEGMHDGTKCSSCGGSGVEKEPT